MPANERILRADGLGSRHPRTGVDRELGHPHSLSPAAGLLSLQRTIGNRAVRRLVDHVGQPNQVAVRPGADVGPAGNGDRQRVIQRLSAVFDMDDTREPVTIDFDLQPVARPLDIQGSILTSGLRLNFTSFRVTANEAAQKRLLIGWVQTCHAVREVAIRLPSGKGRAWKYVWDSFRDQAGGPPGIWYSRPWSLVLDPSEAPTDPAEKLKWKIANVGRSSPPAFSDDPQFLFFADPQEQYVRERGFERDQCQIETSGKDVFTTWLVAQNKATQTNTILHATSWIADWQADIARGVTHGRVTVEPPVHSAPATSERGNPTIETTELHGSGPLSRYDSGIFNRDSLATHFHLHISQFDDSTFPKALVDIYGGKWQLVIATLPHQVSLRRIV